MSELRDARWANAANAAEDAEETRVALAGDANVGKDEGHGLEVDGAAGV